MNRLNIGIFGRVNAGKSTLMNLLTQQETSIVDETPGTTADVKTTVMEIHGLGPVKLFDTAGTDETGLIGDKKREKTLATLKRSDIALLVVNTANTSSAAGDYTAELEILSLATARDKQVFIVHNLFAKQAHPAVLPIPGEQPQIALDLSDKTKLVELIDFLKRQPRVKLTHTPLLPLLDPERVVFLNIPMDDESPEGRFLRPQMMVEEYLVRRYVPTFAYRMNLAKARSTVTEEYESEKQRFDSFVSLLQKDNRLQLLITDSQAMDIITKWTQGAPYMLTTFSIVMMNFMSGGNLELFLTGIEAFESLKPGDRIMIAEGCNHDRKSEDIGTVQIPKCIDERFGKGNVLIDHYFGRVFAKYDKLEDYKLVIHCGGCMLDQQGISSRIRDLIESGVSFTNYGILLSYLQGVESLNRVLEPFGLRVQTSIGKVEAP